MVGKPNWLEEVDYIMALAKKYPVMDKDTELETVLRYKEITDLKCKEKKQLQDKLVYSNVRLVFEIARKYIGQGLSFGDLFQEGLAGFIKGIDRYDPDKGYKLSTYATWWVRQAIGKALHNHSRLIRLPVHLIEKMNKFKKISKQFDAKGERFTKKQIQELANLTDSDISRIDYVNSKVGSILSLDMKCQNSTNGGDDSRETLIDFIVDENIPEPSENSTSNMLSEHIAELLKNLRPREKQVIEMRYGFFNGEKMTLRSIASIMGVTRERVRQIEVSALKKLRDPIKDSGLEIFI